MKICILAERNNGEARLAVVEVKIEPKRMTSGAYEVIGIVPINTKGTNTATFTDRPISIRVLPQDQRGNFTIEWWRKGGMVTVTTATPVEIENLPTVGGLIHITKGDHILVDIDQA